VSYADDAVARIPAGSDDLPTATFRIVYSDLLRSAQDATREFTAAAAWDLAVRAVREYHPDFEPDPSWRVA
jgi:hypothetical protein